jgi:hypothetical protein
MTISVQHARCSDNICALPADSQIRITAALRRNANITTTVYNLTCVYMRVSTC